MEPCLKLKLTIGSLVLYLVSYFFLFIFIYFVISVERILPNLKRGSCSHGMAHEFPKLVKFTVLEAHAHPPPTNGGEIWKFGVKESKVDSTPNVIPIRVALLDKNLEIAPE